MLWYVDKAKCLNVYCYRVVLKFLNVAGKVDLMF